MIFNLLIYLLLYNYLFIIYLFIDLLIDLLWINHILMIKKGKYKLFLDI